MRLTKKNYKVLADGRGLYEQEIIDVILNNRGIKDVEHFLHPTQKDLLPLTSLKNVQTAMRIIKNGIDKQLNFGVLWDVDTDGVSAGTIMTRYLKHFTDKVSSYINNGKAHGLIGQDIKRFEGLNILIIVDSLDKDTSKYEELFCEGIEIIILDHHVIDPKVDYDTYVTLVSSQRDYKNTELSGAGVVWKFCKYLDKKFNTKYANEYLDLACCGILADVCSIAEDCTENRYIVKKGLESISNPAIKKIVGSYEFNSKAVLFSVAPLINAACRMYENQTVMELFLADDNKEVLRLKKILEKCREKQNEEIDRLLPSVREDFDRQKDSNFLYSVIETPYGICGVIGSKFVESYNKPLLILKDCGNKYCGSMRSIGYGDFMGLCNKTELAELHGHEQASGIEIDKRNFNEFYFTVNDKLNTIVQTTSEDIEVDCVINVEDITFDLVKKIKEINLVSGNGFKPVTFKVENIEQYGIGSFKQGKHLVITPSDYIQIIQWNTHVDYDELEDCALMNEPIEVIGELDSGFFARKFMMKVIISDLKVGA